MSDYLNKLVETRQRAWHEAKALLDSAAGESRDLSAEEEQFVARTFADLDASKAKIDEMLAAEKREAEIAEAIRGLEVVRPAAVQAPAQDDEALVRSLLRGEIRSAMFGMERRDVLKTSTNSPVPTTFAGQVADQARMVGPMLDPSVVTVLNTAGGEDYSIPTLSTWSTAGLEAEAAEIDESDPSFGNVTLKAYKHAFVVQVSSEMVADSSVDILGFVAQQAGNALGYRANAVLTVGTGTVQPNGIVNAASSGITGATSVTGAFTGDNLIDLVYSVDGAARRMPGFGIMANGSSIAAMRKLKNSATGDYVFVPTLQPGTPDSILGYPLIESPHMVSAGTAKKSVLAGHLPSYITRLAGGIRIDRSDEFAFQHDLVTLRFIVRLDGALPQASHIKYFVGGAS